MKQVKYTVHNYAGCHGKNKTFTAIGSVANSILTDYEEKELDINILDIKEICEFCEENEVEYADDLCKECTTHFWKEMDRKERINACIF